MKKFIIFSVCLVTICAVLGLSDNLNYNGFKKAIENIKANADIIVDDFQSLSLVGEITSNIGDVYVVNRAKNGNNYVLSIGYYATDEPEVKIFNFATEKVRDKYYSMLKPIADDFENRRSDTIKSFFIPGVSSERQIVGVMEILWTLRVIATSLFMLISVLFDFVGILFAVFESGFYLIGIGRIA